MWIRRSKWVWVGILALLILDLAGCAFLRSSPSGIQVQRGLASWYGKDFHGRPTSSGEPYDMFRHTAAHRTLPLGTVVEVINLQNGKTTRVRINDRGPFVRGRIIDLSYAAARDLGMVEAGVVPVELRVLRWPSDAPRSFLTVQVGSFRNRRNAEQLARVLEQHYEPVVVVPYEGVEGRFYRVQVGATSSWRVIRRLERHLQKEGYETWITRRERP